VRRVAIVTLVTCVALAPAAWAENRQATVGNYYFEDDNTGSRTSIAVRKGDQVTFTVRQAAATPHTVEVDELDIHSGDLLVGQTYTTPPLNTPGNFYLYCRRHEERGHHARLIVQAAASTPAPAKTAAPRTTTAPPRTRSPAATAAPVTASPAPAASPVATATLAPAGVGTAAPDVMRRPLRVDPDSLEGLTGVRRSNEVPWTRAVWWLLIAAVPIVGAAAFALYRNVRLPATHDVPQRTAPQRKRTPKSKR
jgi:plastocyanin